MDDEDLQPNTGSGAFEKTKLKFEHPIDADLSGHVEAKLQIGIDPADGLPRPISTPFDDHLEPALDPETLLCMEDASQYVLRDPSGRIMATFAPAEVSVTREGRSVVSRVTALSRLEKRGITLQLALGALTQGSEVEVAPIRPQCRNYARQMVNFPGERGHHAVRRFCQALRTEDGEFESLGGAEVYACELRNPPDPQSAKKLNEFDVERVRLGRQRLRRHDHEFSVTAEIERQAGLRHEEPQTPTDTLTGGGIFRSR